MAPDLLGRVLVRRLAAGTLLAARIVETEAYEQDDPASHAFRGPTSRNGAMFGGPGRLYVYFTYGMHFCMNVVSGRVGEGAAVLLRAAEPLSGLTEMRTSRGRTSEWELCSGPARLCQAFGVDRSFDGIDVVRGGEIWIAEGTPAAAASIVAGPRIGIGEGIELPWRFFVQDDPFVSKGRSRDASRSEKRGPSTR